MKRAAAHEKKSARCGDEHDGRHVDARYGDLCVNRASGGVVGEGRGNAGSQIATCERERRTSRTTTDPRRAPVGGDLDRRSARANDVERASTGNMKREVSGVHLTIIARAGAISISAALWRCAFTAAFQNVMFCYGCPRTHRARDFKIARFVVRFAGSRLALRECMRTSLVVTALLSAYFLTGCFGFARTGGNGMYYGGGGIGLFLVILALGLVFGRGRGRR